MTPDTLECTAIDATLDPALQRKVDFAYGNDKLVEIFCEGAQHNVGLKTLASLARAAGVTGNDTAVRKTVALTLQRCVLMGRLHSSVLQAWNDDMRHVRSLQERQVWVREQLALLMDCQCDPYLDTILRQVHKGKTLPEHAVPWQVIVQAMQLIDDGEWTMEKCKL